VYAEYSLLSPLRVHIHEPREAAETKSIRKRLRAIYRKRIWDSMALLFSNRTLRDEAMPTIYLNATVVFTKRPAQILSPRMSSLGNYNRSVWIAM